MNIKGINLKQELQRSNIKQADAAKMLGISRPTLSVWYNKEVLTDDIIDKVRKVFNIDLTNVRNANLIGESRENPSINKEKKGVPYYDIDFVGGFDLVFNNNQVNPAFYIDFLPFNDADYWVNVSGKSMGPLIAHGDLVAIKEVNDWKRFLLEGEIYAVITDNSKGNIIKKV